MRESGQRMRAALGGLGVQVSVVKGCEESRKRETHYMFAEGRRQRRKGRILIVEYLTRLFLYE